MLGRDRASFFGGIELRKKSKHRILLISIVIPIAVLFILVYLWSIFDILKINTSEYLDEIANIAVLAIDRQVKSDMLIVESLAIDIELLQEENVEITGETLRHQSELGHFKRIGLADLNGNIITTDNAEFNVSDRDYFKISLEGKTTVSDTLIDKVDGKMINVYATPIHQDSEITGVLFATYDNENYRNMLSISSFSGNGYSYVVKSDGDVVAYPADEGRVIFKNAFDLFGEDSFEIHTGYAVDAMQEDMKAMEEGMISYSFMGEKRYMNYVPVEINDWYILSIVPAHVAAQRINQVILLTAGIGVLLLAFLLAFFIYLFRSEKKQRAELYEAAFRDHITQKTNYAKFKVDVSTLLKTEDRISFALVKFDIVKFKTINALFGYQEGNRILKIISDKLEAFVEPREMFSRMTADCFVILLTYLDKVQLENRLRLLDKQLLDIPQEQGKNYRMILKYGVFFVGDRGIELSAMLDCADMALKKARENKVEFIEYYAQSMKQQVLREVEIENEMEGALARKEFQIYLQPKYSTESKQIVSAEALVRWIHPVNGIIPPDEFIPLFERNGFIIKLDMYVLDCVCRQLASWRDENCRMVPIAVNISRVHLYDADFLNTVEAMVSGYGIAPSYIEFELTESAIFENIEVLLSVMEGLHARGFSLAMDDFGSGYSSLNLLKQIPLNVVKLDRGFFDGENIFDRSKIVVQNIIHMIHDLQMAVVAEGIETQEQYDFLEANNCDMIQGYLLGRPMPSSSFDALLKKESEAGE